MNTKLIKMNKQDKKFIKSALFLAKKGTNFVWPNPMVGCIIVNKGRISGKGWHKYFGGPHAEINALKDAGKDARGGTMYVTLEPCSHWGKTPPCTEAIIKSGIKKVVCAMKDPNPKVSGRGIAQLKKHNIDVQVGILSSEAKKMNNEYINSLSRKPFVLIKYAMSIDGKIATKTGDAKWITSIQSRKYSHKMRAKFDGILVGNNTIVKDDPSLTSHGYGKNPARIVIDPKLKISNNSNVFDGRSPIVVIHGQKTSKTRQNAFRKKGAILICIKEKSGKLSFKTIVERLSNISIKRIMIEGGGKTIAQALKERIADEIVVFIAPKIISGKDAPTPVEGNGIIKMAQATEIQNIQVKTIGNDIILFGKLRK